MHDGSKSTSGIGAPQSSSGSISLSNKSATSSGKPLALTSEVHWKNPLLIPTHAVNKSRLFFIWLYVTAAVGSGVSVVKSK